MNSTTQAPTENPLSPLDQGACFRFSKTVGESDLYQFAGISGDFAPQHVDEHYMRGTAFGRRIAHGGLVMAYASNVASAAAAKAAERTDETALSYGYDRVRFLRPVFVGDTLQVTYSVVQTDPARRRTTADIEIKNQDGQLVAVAKHIMQWVPRSPA
jgi:acyl dehydratase